VKGDDGEGERVHGEVGGGKGKRGGWREGKGKGVSGEVRCERRGEEVMLILVDYRELMGTHSVFPFFLLPPSPASSAEEPPAHLIAASFSPHFLLST